MTALSQYARLEATGLWRQDPDSQRREVIVALGDASLTISQTSNEPLTHWSLAAVDRANPGEFPALYHPNGDESETLELGEEASDLIEALERLRSAIEKSRPHQGRLRQMSVVAVLVLFAGLLVFWAPDALVRHAVRIMPDIKRQEIGAALLGRIERVAGKACLTDDARAGLSVLAQRTGVRQIVVLPAGMSDSLHLPGGIVLLNKSLIEDHEDPAVTAGFVLAERARATAEDPMARLLRQAGPQAAVRLLTTGTLPMQTLDRAAEAVLLEAREAPSPEALIALFADTGITSRPYAYALDVTGETVLPLIEADPMAGQTPRPVLPDRDWVLLQTVCGG
jgi:hypothetical protein